MYIWSNHRSLDKDTHILQQVSGEKVNNSTWLRVCSSIDGFLFDPFGILKQYIKMMLTWAINFICFLNTQYYLDTLLTNL